MNNSCVVTCVVSTKNRYFSSLPSCLMSIANQTLTPREIIILDDSDNFIPVGNTEPIFKTIFDYFLLRGINWYHIPGEKKGQVKNHIKSLDLAKYPLIFRVDDDCILEPNVLELLFRGIMMRDDIGCIGPLIIPGNDNISIPSIASNKIEDIFLGLNEQWFLTDKIEAYPVDHLYSSFIYRKNLAEYPTNLSPVCHREETILTYGIKQKGYKNIIEPKAIVRHMRNSSGGIRSYNDPKLYEHDEKIFKTYLDKWNVKPREYSHVVLDAGIGDHYAFKNWLPEYFKKNEGKHHIFYTAHPLVFDDIKDKIQLASIQDSKVFFGDLSKFNIYAWMDQNNWKGTLTGAYKKMYELINVSVNVKEKVIREGKGDYILISPYSKILESDEYKKKWLLENNYTLSHDLKEEDLKKYIEELHFNHPKSYPYWNELVKLLKDKGEIVIQIGRTNEPKIEGVDEFIVDRSFKELEDKVSNCKYWIGVDNFFQHMINCMESPVKGIVIFGMSDPEIFGYSYNKNILKSKDYLRTTKFNYIKQPDGSVLMVQIDGQNLFWNNVKKNDEVFLGPQEVFKVIYD